VKLVAVVGSGSGCGKTTVISRILRGIPGLGAVKLSPREGESRVEWGPGDPGKDTDLYARSGAARVARIVGPRESAAQTWGEIRAEFGDCRGVVIEGSRAVDFPEEKCVLFVAGRQSLDAREERSRGLMAISDVIVEMMPHADTIKAPFLTLSSHFLDGKHSERAGGESCPPSVDLDLLVFIREFLGLEERG
jgi:molybdopterin-guanine dinucleotide biosynthesis protein